MPSTHPARPDAHALAEALRDAPFVRIVARADGDALAASGILARAIRTVGVPFQVRVTPDPIDVQSDDLVVSIGVPGGDVVVDDDSPGSVTAYETAAALDVDPNPVLALAGVVAAESVPGAAGSDAILDAAVESNAVRRRPGVAVPTADLGDGLAHSTLSFAPFSGDGDASQALLAELGLPATLDNDAHRRIASAVAIETVAADGATPRAAERVERLLRPYETPDSQFATVGGWADVLDAVAREEPGTGVALVLGHDARAAALDAWRTHARAVHTQLATATTGRYDGLFVARVDEGTPGQLSTAARLLRDFRSPEPVALVVTERAAGAAGVEATALGTVIETAAKTCDGGGYGDDRRGVARFDDDVQRFITAFREAV